MKDDKPSFQTTTLWKNAQRGLAIQRGHASRSRMEPLGAIYQTRRSCS